MHGAFRDEQPIGDGRLSLGSDSRGAPTGVYGCLGAGKRGGEY